MTTRFGFMPKTGGDVMATLAVVAIVFGAGVLLIGGSRRRRQQKN